MDGNCGAGSTALQTEHAAFEAELQNRRAAQRGKKPKPGVTKQLWRSTQHPTRNDLSSLTTACRCRWMRL